MNDERQAIIVNGSRGVTSKSTDMKKSADALNVAQLKELFAKERKHTES